MQLDPQSVAFVCEAIVGIAPSVTLLRHFFLLHLTDPRQCSGCLSFQAVAVTAGSWIDFELPPSASDFLTLWVYVDVGVLSPLLSSPSAPTVPSSGSAHEKLTSPRLAFVWLRMRRLKDLGLTVPMVMEEFLRRCIAPLQRQSRPMWALSVGPDHMMLQEFELPLAA